MNGAARHRTALLVLAGLFLLSLPAVTDRIYASDEVEGFAWLHSLAFDRDVSFQNEYEYFYDSGQVKNPGFHDTFLSTAPDRLTPLGRHPNFTTMGAALLWAPFYGLGHVLAMAKGAPADGLSQPYITAVAWGSAVYGFLAVLLSAAIARRAAGDGLAAAAAVWLGTPLLFYMYVTPVFTHACSAFAVTLFLWIWIRVREAGWPARGALLLGLAGGLVTIVRAQDALFLAGPALDFLRFAIARPEPVAGSRKPEAGGQQPAARSLQAVAASACGFVLALAPQLLAFQALNGRLRQSEYETRKMSWISPHGLQVLLDREHGLFFWTPLAVVAVVGLIALAARGGPDRGGSQTDRRWMAVLCLVMFALQAYIAGAVESWTVAGAFGQRRFVSLTPILVVGVAALIAEVRRRPGLRAGVAAALAVCVWWNLGLMAQFGLHTMDRERLTLGSNARETFIDLPARAPALVWRYLTNRSSFYNQPRQ